MKSYADLLFTGSVRSLQDADGTGDKYAKVYSRRTLDEIDDDVRVFVESRTSFYMATVSATGWPYVQHRGGPAGFLKVTGPETLGFADYRGNRQYISQGHLEDSAKVALFLMDYPRKARLKIPADLFNQQGVLRHGECMLANRLAVPARHTRKPVRNILDLDVHGRRVDKVQSPP